MKKENQKSDSQIFVDAVINGKDDIASKKLEKMLKLKTARRIKQVLHD